MTLSVENVYNLIPKEKEQILKPPKYISQFRPSVIKESRSQLADHKTFGVTEYPKPDPKAFLKKKDREERFSALRNKLREEREENEKHDHLRKDSVPSKNDRPVHGIMTRKNFIKQNVAENVMSVPKRPHKFIVDTVNGDKYDLIPSGLEKVYVSKNNYGCIPNYLMQKKEQVRHAQEEYDRYMREMKERSALKQLTEVERQEILRGLNKNWQKLYALYQGLSVMVDTAPKKHRKELLEHEMEVLEKDIELIEKHKIIMLAK
ncbi:hypothetical protein Ciccas_006450 [Cichlidogyrus casuarinus]|uniref:Enkurin domain-containing protein n=1 Tax=Cichlidogyrus casuarinus TaxID=1844966 RepID=A0ABD2Q5P7_9PLAT